MQKMMRFIIENITSGKIERETAAMLLKYLKNADINPKEDIAIIGIGAKLPLSNSIDEFWANIKNNVDYIGRLPESRKSDIERYYNYTGLENTKDLKYSECAYIEDIDKFDYRLFRLSPNEANLMDPYQRLFLQAAWNAIEDAGYSGKKSSGSKTGVYVGYASNAKDCYLKMILDVDPSLMADAGVGNVTAMLPSRIAYLLDLKGPTMVLDTACSSSMISVHLACQALQTGDCDMAIAGGIKMNLLPVDKEYLKMGIESSDGRTRTFDEYSDGAGMGEGIITIVLKPLSKAKRDKDNIYAVIKSSAVNQDGSSIGITAPNPDSQRDVILKAWEKADINPETLSYIEAHGTGTELGDPLEIDGLEKAFRRYTDKNQICALGTIKTNLGHGYESAGLAGLLKCILILKNRQIPPNLFFNKPNSKIDFTKSPIYVNNKLRKWDNQDLPMRCAISSFGFSGTNCHMVLEEAPIIERKGEVSNVHIFTLSAKSSNVLENLISNYIQFLEKSNEVELGDICYTANAGRGHYKFRFATVVTTLEELKEKLRKVLDEGLDCLKNYSGYFAAHKIVPQNKKEKLTGEITEKDRINFSRQAQEKIKSFIESNRENIECLTEIAQLYIQGAEVQWDELYKNEAVRKISLPTYPFEDNRCWINIPEGEKKIPLENKADKFYTIGWQVEKISSNDSVLVDGSVLIFKGEKDISDAITEKYILDGREVIEVEMGSSFKEINKNKYIISGEEEDYYELMKVMKNRNLSKIIHMMTLNNNTEIGTLNELEDHQKKGVLSLTYLTRAIDRAEIHQELDVVLISDYTTQINGFEERIKPENTILFGMGKVVRKEQFNVLCRCIDIDDSTTVQDIFPELELISDWYNVAYRRGVRYVEEFREIDVDLAEDRNIEIKADGVYVVTGGMGGIGLEVAKYLASKEKVILGLINRTPIPDRGDWNRIIEAAADMNTIKKIKEIREIEAMGAIVECFSANIANFKEVENVLNEIRKRYGKINGLVHGAGVGGAAPILTRTKEEFNQIFSPKVYGTWILDKLTRNDELDFFILFSSIATMFSAPGQGDYIAGNAYLDSYSYYRNMLGKRTITINWSTWKETGMSVHHDFTIDTLFKTLLNQEGIGNMDIVINKDIPRVLIGEINYTGSVIYLIEKFMLKLSNKIRKLLYLHIGHIKKKGKRKEGTGNGEVKITGRENDEYSELELKVGKIMAEILGFSEIGIYDNFYELGGDSISGLKIANSIQNDLGIQISVVDLLTFITIADIAKHLESLGSDESVECKNTYSAIEPVEKMDYYPASSAQKRLFFINEMEGSNINYNIYQVVLIEGMLDIQRFKDSFKQLIKRHESLRTYFKVINEEVVQIIKDEVDFDIEVVNTREDLIDDEINKFITPFSLSEAPLLRIKFLKISDQKYVVILDMHHIITDGVSIDILINEFTALYEGNELDELRIQYKDYAVHQNQIQNSDLLTKQEEYWLEMFAGEIPVLNLPTDYPRPKVKSFEGSTVSRELSSDLLEHIYTLAKDTDTTLFVVLLSTYYILLYKYSAQDDIIIGTPIVGRYNADLEKIIGMFVNTLVLRCRPNWAKTYKEFLQEVKTNSLNAFDNQDCQLEEFLTKLKIKRDVSRNPLFDVMFVLQNVGVNEICLKDMKISSYDLEEKAALFDLELEAYERDNNLTLNLNYSTKLYKKESAIRILDDYVGLLNIICDNIDLKIGDMRINSAMKIEEESPLDIEDDFTFNF
ncbi:MAG: SDR family NAD(P)-dependent oxidoreductase [Halanaerobiales bacterium]|nr:SDR family NAD(P)-dependent oxidoreductase [Halanaerobiales bacterium]